MFRGTPPRSWTRSALVVALLAAVLGGLLFSSAAWALPVPTEVVGQSRGPKPEPIQAASGQLMLQLQPGTAVAQLQFLANQQGGAVLQTWPRYNLALVSLPAGVSVADGIRQWTGLPGVAKPVPNYIVHATATPNDPLYSNQLHLPQIKCPAAWDRTTGSSNVVIAIIDTGVQIGHEDLASRIWTNPNPTNGDLHGYHFALNRADPNPDLTQNDTAACHGTHVAGIAAAASNNGIGVTGVDWKAQIMAVGVLDGHGMGTDAWVLSGIDYAVTHGASIINMSLGEAIFNDTFTQPLTDAFNKGVVVVCAAMNNDWQFGADSSTWFSPVCNDGPNPGDNHVLGVASVGSDDVRAVYSDYDGSGRSFVDVSAPGGDPFRLPVGPIGQILSTFAFTGATPFTVKYEYEQGTSMASPVVAGLCGLVRAQFPSFTPAQVITQVRRTTDNIDAKNPGFAGQLGTGRVNAANAVTPIKPGPPRSVMANDTPGDEGGSITVSWGKSLDDGRNLKSVVSYEVLRATSATGALTSLKVLPKGTTILLDTPVPNDTPYWYQVVAADALGNSSASAVVGPASARDDLAPPPVTQLTAVDTPADNGSSITLNWSGYTIPPEQNDFLQYNVYRGTGNAFSDVTGITDTTTPVTRIAVITDVNNQGYVDTTVTDGTKYWYAVTAVDLRNNENRSVTSVGPAVSSPNFSFSWPSGLSMISIGADTPNPDMADIFGVTDPTTLDLSRYDPTTNAYHQFSATGGSTDPFLTQAPGRAFWLSTKKSVTLSVAGQPVPAGDFTVALQSGWNMVGNPFTADIDLADPGTGKRLGQIVVGGTTISLDASNDQEFTRNYFWRYDAPSNAYRLVSASMGALGESKIRRGQGVFFRAFTGCKLILPRPTGAAVPKVGTAAVANAAPTADSWALRIVAQSDGLASNDNFLGVSPQAAKLSGVVPPPFPGPGVRAVFVGETAKPGSVTDFVSALGTSHTWKLRVTSDLANVRVNLTWPDLSTMPASLKPRLTDPATGRSVYMRTSSGYSFDVADAATPRELQLTVDSDNVEALTLSAVQAAPAAGGADIMYTLSAAANVTVDIMNVAGRPVRQVLSDRLSPAGVGHAIWDGRGGSGTPVPTGQYLVRVRAAGPDGQTVNAVRPLMLRR